jgi:hypothetical protein
MTDSLVVNPELTGLAWQEVEVAATLTKKEIKFSSYIGKFRAEQLQSHI